MGAQASGVSVGINRSLWNCLAGDKDVLRATVSVSIMVGLDSGHLTHGVLHASGEKTVNITRWMLAKAASDKTVGKPPTLRSSDVSRELRQGKPWDRRDGAPGKSWEFTRESDN